MFVVMVVVMITIMVILGVLMGILIFAIFFWVNHMVMKLGYLMKKWLDKGLPDFFLLDKAFNLNLIINIILDVTGHSSFNYNLYFSLTNDISSDPQVSLEYDGFLGDA